MENNGSKFTSTYNCHDLIYLERYESFIEAYSREQQLKKWTRKKKELLIKSLNPRKISLNEMIINPHHVCEISNQINQERLSELML